MDEDGLLFRSGARHLFWREHIDTLYQSTDDFGIQFLDLGVLLDLCEEGVDVKPLRLGFGEGLTQRDHPCLEVFLFLLIGRSREKEKPGQDRNRSFRPCPGFALLFSLFRYKPTREICPYPSFII